MNAEAYIKTIESVKKDHIDYILKVNEVLGIEKPSSYTQQLNQLSYTQVIELSSEAEKAYKSHCDNVKLDKLIKEIKNIGVDAVLNKYEIEKVTPNE